MRITHLFVDMLIATYPQNLLHITARDIFATLDFVMVGLSVLAACLALINLVLQWKEDDDFAGAVFYTVLFVPGSLLMLLTFSWRWMAAASLLYLVVVVDRIRREGADDTHGTAGAPE